MSENDCQNHQDNYSSDTQDHSLLDPLCHGLLVRWASSDFRIRGSHLRIRNAKTIIIKCLTGSRQATLWVSYQTLSSRFRKSSSSGSDIMVSAYLIPESTWTMTAQGVSHSRLHLVSLISREKMDCQFLFLFVIYIKSVSSFVTPCW